MNRPAKYRYQKERHWSWPTRVAVGAGGLIVVVGVGAALLLLFGRPAVSVSSSGPALFEVHLGGFGTRLVARQATSDGQPLALASDARGLVPTDQLAQGQAVRVTATAAAPSWLHWLLGRSVSTTETLQTPAATPSAPVALSPRSGVVPVSFDHPVTIVRYEAGGGPSMTLQLKRPSTVAEIPVPPQAAGGLLQVAAAPRPWETVAFAAQHRDLVRGADREGTSRPGRPGPGVATAAPNAPISLTFAQPVASCGRAGRRCRHRWPGPGPSRPPTCWCSPRAVSASVPARPSRSPSTGRCRWSAKRPATP